MGDVADVVDGFEHVPAENLPADDFPVQPTASAAVPPERPAIIDDRFPEPAFEPAPAAVVAVVPVADEPDSLTGQLAILLPGGVAEEQSAADAGQIEVEAVAGQAEPADTAGQAETAEAQGLPDDLLAVAQGLDEPEEVAGEPAPDAPDAEDSAIEDGAVPEAGEAGAPETESLDDIAPGTVNPDEPGDAEDAELMIRRSSSVANWPFVLYVALWFAAAGIGVWEFLQVPAGQAIFDSGFYVTSVIVGLGLLALGPVILLVVWVVTLFTREDARGGVLFISALIKGASATLLGAIIWMGALMLIDFLRVGRLL